MSNILKTFYRFILKYKLPFIGSIIIFAISSLLGNIGPVFLKSIVTHVENGQMMDSLNFLIYWIIAEVFAVLLYALAVTLSDNSLFPAVRDLRLAVFKHIHSLDFVFHTNKSSGSLISKFKRGQAAFFQFYVILNHFFVTIGLDIIVMVGFLLTLYPKLVVVWAIIFVVNLIATYFTVRNNIRKRDFANMTDDLVSATTVDNMIAFDTVMYFANEKYEQERLERDTSLWHRAGLNYAMTFRFIDIGNGAIIWLGVVLIIGVALIDLIEGIIGLGTFTMAVAFATYLGPKLFHIVSSFRDLAKNYIDLKDYIALLDEKVQIVDTPKSFAMKEWMKELKDKSASRIEFEDLSFSYGNNKFELKNINLDIEPGESIALVGKSGAGKSSLVKLLLRFYDVTSGAIRIGDVDIRDVTKEVLRKRIGVVPQDTVLFNETIGYNIAYGAEEFTMKDIEQACKAANLWDYIKSLPDGVRTLVGERGIRLSGGQRQRLAIARVIMEDAPIIVFDEATSSLDSESEKLIQDAFWKLAKKKTTIIIAHRLSTIKKADRIIVLDEGKVIEQGSHSDLVKKDTGLYKKLWELQTFGDGQII
jgi:ATP-binding cassette, subfamily B, heavy metal transporter